MFCTSARVADVREHSSKILEINKTKTFVILWQMEDLSRLTCLLKGFYSALNFLIDPICLSLIEHIQEGNPGVRQPKSEILDKDLERYEELSDEGITTDK